MEILKNVESILHPLGFECHPFKIGWYNEKVDPAYQFNYLEDTLAIIVISTPCMFEKAFKPFLIGKGGAGIRDPIDECVASQFEKVRQFLPNEAIETIYDFELHHSRRPKVLVQTAGHVAGAVRYYKRSDVINDPWEKQKKIFPVCIHPKYGGWFALRGVMIFTTRQVPDLKQKDPPDVLKEEKDIIAFLDKFNNNWKDWTFRDVILVEDSYSEEQKLYFETEPKDRKSLVNSWLNDKIQSNS